MILDMGVETAAGTQRKLCAGNELYRQAEPRELSQKEPLL